LTPPVDQVVGFEEDQPKAFNRIVTSRFARNCEKSGPPALLWLRFVTLQMTKNDRKSGFLQAVVTNRKSKKMQNETKTRILAICGYDSKYIFSGFISEFSEFFPKNVVTIELEIVSNQAFLRQLNEKQGKPQVTIQKTKNLMKAAKGGCLVNG